MDAKSDKAPGVDGITAKFYKVVKYELVDMMDALFNEIPENGTIPESWKEATITLIPKDSQDLTNVKNYRPISLLNNDYNFFAKIWAERLKKVMDKVIGKQQARFLPKRYLRDNLRTLLDAIEYYDKCIDKEVAFFVDAEKAFDNLNWDFLKILEKMDLGDKFKETIKAGMGDRSSIYLRI